MFLKAKALAVSIILWHFNHQFVSYFVFLFEMGGNITQKFLRKVFLFATGTLTSTNKFDVICLSETYLDNFILCDDINLTVLSCTLV